MIKVSEKMTKREQIEVEMIKRLITSYFDVVKKNICDTVPKTIISFLVNGVLYNKFSHFNDFFEIV